jgi:GTP-sensing pleiotropic transcriptional regulator CodY
MAKAIRSILAILAVTAAGQALAYQVTGEVKDVSDSSITVVQEKGKNKGEKFEMARDASTKVSGDLKKGSKVTVEYAITAKSIEVKAAKEKGKKK